VYSDKKKFLNFISFSPSNDAHANFPKCFYIECKFFCVLSR
jgi:hypothetical protein